MLGELFINQRDAYMEYGISMEQTALSALMSPPPMKSAIESRYRTIHGKKVVNNNPRYDARDLTLAIHITARNKEQFFQRYNKFCQNVLARGELQISTKYQPNVVYKCLYVSCQQFSEFMARYAVFSLKLTEPDPSDRTIG